MNKERGITIVLVSHNMDDVADHADRVLVMENGQLKMDGKTEEVFVRKDELTEMGLGVPQAVEFYLDLKEILEEAGHEVVGRYAIQSKESGSISEDDRVIPRKRRNKSERNKRKRHRNA